MLYTSGFVDDVMFSHNGSNIRIEAWSVRRSELFTATRQVAALNCFVGTEVIIIIIIIIIIFFNDKLTIATHYKIKYKYKINNVGLALF